jgi:hypothetical protein
MKIVAGKPASQEKAGRRFGGNNARFLELLVDLVVVLFGDSRFNELAFRRLQDGEFAADSRAPESSYIRGAHRKLGSEIARRFPLLRL